MAQEINDRQDPERFYKHTNEPRSEPGRPCFGYRNRNHGPRQRPRINTSNDNSRRQLLSINLPRPRLTSKVTTQKLQSSAATAAIAAIETLLRNTSEANGSLNRRT